MGSIDYEKVWTRLSLRMVQLMEERAALEIQMSEVDNEITQLDKAMKSLQPLAGTTMPQESVAGMGMTDAISQVLLQSCVEQRTKKVPVEDIQYMSANDIQKKMVDMGFDFRGYTIPMASIYKVLERLEKKRVIEKQKRDWKSFYRWKPPNLR
jgi:hypothetical protein